MSKPFRVNKKELENEGLASNTLDVVPPDAKEKLRENVAVQWLVVIVYRSSALVHNHY